MYLPFHTQNPDDVLSLCQEWLLPADARPCSFLMFLHLHPLSQRFHRHPYYIILSLILLSIFARTITHILPNYNRTCPSRQGHTSPKSFTRQLNCWNCWNRFCDDDGWPWIGRELGARKSVVSLTRRTRDSRRGSRQNSGAPSALLWCVRHPPPKRKRYLSSFMHLLHTIQSEFHSNRRRAIGYLNKFSDRCMEVCNFPAFYLGQDDKPTDQPTDGNAGS